MVRMVGCGLNVYLSDRKDIQLSTPARRLDMVLLTVYKPGGWLECLRESTILDYPCGHTMI